MRTRKYPACSRGLDGLIVGVELEYLIEKESEPLALINREEALELYSLLTSDFGFKVLTPRDSFRLSMETKVGYVTVKPDFAFHLVEISLPPRGSPSELAQLITFILDRLDQALARLKFRRATYSAYPKSSIRYDMVESDRLARFMKYAESAQIGGSPFSNPNYPAIISSVQVHLNILTDEFFPLLPYLYEPEWKIVSMFSNSSVFDEETIGCARILFYEMTLGSNYFLKTIPPIVPKSWDDYASAFNKTPSYDHNGASALPRDYSLIRPREFGSVEFRSACSQISMPSIMAICAMRILQLLYAKRSLGNGHKFDDKVTRDALLKWSKLSTQLVHRSEFESVVDARIKLAVSEMPNEWHRYLPNHMK
jgi:hypothetical protein